MSDESAGGAESQPIPLDKRDESPVDRTTDLVLLLAAEDGATYSRIRSQLDSLDLEPFPFEITEKIDGPVQIDEYQPHRREPHSSLEFLEIVGYVDEFDYPVDVDAPIHLTEKGTDGAQALRAGLHDSQKTVLDEVKST